MTKRTIKVDVEPDVDMPDWQVKADVEGALKRAGYEPGEVEVETPKDPFELWLDSRRKRFKGMPGGHVARKEVGIILEGYHAHLRGEDPQKNRDETLHEKHKKHGIRQVSRIQGYVDEGYTLDYAIKKVGRPGPCPCRPCRDKAANERFAGRHRNVRIR